MSITIIDQWPKSPKDHNTECLSIYENKARFGIIELPLWCLEY